MRLRRRPRTRWVDPIGWDHAAGQAHDVSFLPTVGVWLHHSTCWCRAPHRPSHATVPTMTTQPTARNEAES